MKNIPDKLHRDEELYPILRSALNHLESYKRELRVADCDCILLQWNGLPVMILDQTAARARVGQVPKGYSAVFDLYKWSLIGVTSQ